MKKKISSFIVDTIFIAAALGITDVLMEHLFKSESFLLELVVYVACFLLLKGIQWFSVYLWKYIILRNKDNKTAEEEK